MAINVIPQESKMRLQLDGGLDEKGNAVIKSKTYSRVKSDAINDDIYSIATSLLGE